MTESVTPPKERLVDPETGETPPLSPPPPRPLIFVLDPEKRRIFIEGEWEEGHDTGSWEG